MLIGHTVRTAKEARQLHPNLRAVRECLDGAGINAIPHRGALIVTIRIYKFVIMHRGGTIKVTERYSEISKNGIPYLTGGFVRKTIDLADPDSLESIIEYFTNIKGESCQGVPMRAIS